MKKMRRTLSLLLSLTMVMGTMNFASAEANAKYVSETTADGWIRVTQEGGETLGYSPESGVTLIEADGFAFKDLNKNGVLDAYEDWRLTDEERTADLVSQMTIEQISGLRANGATFGLISEDGVLMDSFGNDMKTEIIENGLRFVIMYPIAFGTDLKLVPPTSNAMQQWAEASVYGIPMMLNCDPTTTMTGTVTNMALAATFDPEKVKELSTNVSKMYRAAGITMSLSPQVDLETDPRSQSTNAFTEDPALAASLVNAMISAYQSTYAEDGTDLGWGEDSLAVQFKHFFANLSNEGGRNYHDYTGKYVVFPGEQIETQLVPFVEGGFNLDSLTKQAAAIMVTYTVLSDEDEAYGPLVGGAWNEYIYEMLEKYGFEGMVSTDSLIMQDSFYNGMTMRQTAYNVGSMSDVEACYSTYKLGTDQTMGDFSIGTIKEAYDLYVQNDGEEAANENWKNAAHDILLPIFEVGSFENPYVVNAESTEVFNALIPDSTNELAQSSIVMLKNDGVIAQDTTGEKKTAYVISNGDELPVSKKTLKQYFDVVTDPAEAELAIVFVDSPARANTGYDEEEEQWEPISLQYRPYTADGDNVREESLFGDTVTTQTESPYGVVTTTEVEDRGYYDVTGTVTNEADLDLILETAELGLPVVVCVNASGAMCYGEFESEVNAILMGFGVDQSNYLPLIAGQVEPSGMLPLQMPKDMEDVEGQCEDVPRDMECYTDANGNKYDFAFGLNWAGVISDERTEKYAVDVQVGLSK